MNKEKKIIEERKKFNLEYKIKKFLALMKLIKKYFHDIILLHKSLI